MSTGNPLENYQPKSFWKRPEGVLGMIFLIAFVGGGAFLLNKYIATLVVLASNTLYLAMMLVVLAALIYMVLDPKMRNLVFYMYRSVMRSITGVFVQIDPIGILKSYVESLQVNLRKMSKQIGKLRGQKRRLQRIISQNKSDIEKDLQIANRAKQENKRKQVVLKVRRAGRLKESNMRLEDLYNKIEVLERVLIKMYDNSELLLEDIKDQVKVKEIERKAIHTSHSAMRSARNIISGNKDQKQMFDMAMEAITEDVGNKVGEMERFMEVSSGFMDGIDLQNGVFEEEGLKMLEQWEQESESLILGDEKNNLLLPNTTNTSFDLDQPIAKPQKKDSNNDYTNLFD